MSKAKANQIRSFLVAALLINFLPFALGMSRASAAESHLVTTTTNYRVTADRTGMYRLTYADLASAGAPVQDMVPHNLHLTTDSPAVEVAIEVTGAADGRFDPEDEIRFFGQARDSKYGAANVYWLAIGNSPGLRMAERNVAPAAGAAPPAFRSTQVFEQDLLYRSSLPALANADHWFWSGWVVQPGQSQTLIYTLSVANPVAGPASLTVAFQGEFFSYAIPLDHSVELSLNGHALGSVAWDDAQPFSHTFEFDGAWLSNGDNTLTVTALGNPSLAVESGYVDAITLSYARAYQSQGDLLAFAVESAGSWKPAAAGFSSANVALYDTTSPNAPQVLRQAQAQPDGAVYTLTFSDNTSAAVAYLAVGDNGWLAPLAVEARTAAADLRDTNRGADYIVISHPDFLSAVQPLAAHRAASGLRVEVVDVQDVYDQFGGGLLSAEAIRDFLQFAYAQWAAPAPRYVLLVGDGTYDFKDVAGLGNKTLIPPYLALVDALLGETASDNYFVNFDSDPLPEMSIGRFPVKTAVQATAVVNKVLAYEATPASADWMRKAALVADKFDPLAGNFAALSDEGLPYFPPEYSVDRIYLGTTSHPTAQMVNSALMSAVNSGRFFINYTGHGDTRSWGASLLRTQNVPNMTNGSRLPIMTTMGCEVGYFIFPYYDALSEVLVTHPTGGAVATWAGSGKGTSIGQQWLYKGFLDAVFDQGMSRLGPALDAAKQHLYANAPQWAGLIDTFHLFGDPALALPMPRAEMSVSMTAEPAQPRSGEAVTLTVALTNLGQLAAQGSQVTVTLSSSILGGHFEGQGGPASPKANGPLTTLTYTVGDLAPGQSETVHVVGVVSPNVNPGVTLEVAVQVASTNPDGDPQNNSFALPLTVGALQGSLAGVNFVDTNGNGVRDAGEMAGLSGIQVAALNGSGAVVRLVTSDQTGAWRMDGLDPGDYEVVVDTQGQAVTTVSRRPVTLAAGASVLDLYFGFLQPTGVTIVDLHTTPVARGVAVHWSALFAHGDETYQVERSLTADGPFTAVSDLLAGAGQPDGWFTWQDTQAQPGQTYWYRLIVGPTGVTVGPVSGLAGGLQLFVPLVVR